MRRAIQLFIILFASALSACSVASLPWVVYDAPATVSSDRTAAITTTTGIVEGYSTSTTLPAGGMFITVPGGPTPSWVNFNAEDIAIFAASLERELNRLGVAKAQRGEQGTSADIALTLHFDRTVKGAYNEYQLDVRLVIQTASNQIEKSYNVRSFTDEGFWARANTTAKTSKRMAAQKLMQAIIPDIESAIRAEQPQAPDSTPPSAAFSSEATPPVLTTRVWS